MPYFFFPLSGACVSAEPDTFRVSAEVNFPVFNPLLAMELTLFDVFSFFAMLLSPWLMDQKTNSEISVAEQERRVQIGSEWGQGSAR